MLNCSHSVMHNKKDGVHDLIKAVYGGLSWPYPCTFLSCVPGALARRLIGQTQTPDSRCLVAVLTQWCLPPPARGSCLGTGGRRTPAGRIAGNGVHLYIRYQTLPFKAGPVLLIVSTLA